MTAPSPADPLGYDVHVRDDLDPTGRSATGDELLEAAMLHRLQCDRLLMTGAPDDEIEFGENVRRWVNETVNAEELAARAPRLEEVLRRDPRVASAVVSLSLAPSDGTHRHRFTIQISVVAVTGTLIDRIVGVSALTVEYLAQGK